VGVPALTLRSAPPTAQWLPSGRVARTGRDARSASIIQGNRVLLTDRELAEALAEAI